MTFQFRALPALQFVPGRESENQPGVSAKKQDHQTYSLNLPGREIQEVAGSLGR